jgi:hypothetical protein
MSKKIKEIVCALEELGIVSNYMGILKARQMGLLTREELNLCLALFKEKAINPSVFVWSVK